jgi:site-specific DNA recombinase
MAKAKTTTQPQRKKVAIYCRVSTYDQSSGDYSSLNSQEDILRKYCDSKGWIIFEVYKDTKSGTSLERDGLSRMLVHAEQGKFNIVAVTKLDRISRSVMDFLQLDEKLRKLEIDIVVATQNIDTTTPTGKMQRTIMLAFAEFERDMIADRTTEKLFSQAQKGFWGGGNVILGYDHKDKKLVVNEKEAKLVRTIFKYYLEQPSTSKVAIRLNKEGFRTKIRTSKKGTVKGGGYFTKETIKHMLRSKTYVGKIIYKSKEFKGQHEPIVDDDLFKKVQSKLDQSIKDRMVTYESVSNLSLLGIMRCGHCGSQMTSSSTKKATGKKYYYYKCTRAIKTSKAFCRSKDLKATDIEAFVNKLIKHLDEDSEFFEAVCKQMQSNSSTDIDELEEKHKNLAGNLIIINRELENLMTNLTRSQSLQNSTLVAEKVGTLEKNKTSLETEIQKIKSTIEKYKSQRFNKSSLRELFKKFVAVYDSITLEQKRRFNQALFIEIRSTMEKGSDTGNVEFKIRADGSFSLTWEEIINPENAGSHLRGAWLRE